MALTFLLMKLTDNLLKVKSTVPEGVKLVVVSKTQPAEAIRELYDAGQRSFGENKVQELISKQGVLPRDIEWHLIGHLQTNKVKQIVPFVSLIQSADSLKLLKEINKEALKISRIIPCLLQFHIASEETKFGLDLNEAREILSSPEFHEMKNIRISGVMGMATFTSEENLVRAEFRSLKNIFGIIKEEFFKDDPDFKEISMGMTGDYLLAVEEGSTLVRIGTAIFGERNYQQPS